MALPGNTPDAYGQTWRLPCDDERLSNRQFIELAAEVFGVDPGYSVFPTFRSPLSARD
jgi:hypothetical protein